MRVPKFHQSVDTVLHFSGFETRLLQFGGENVPNVRLVVYQQNATARRVGHDALSQETPVSYPELQTLNEGDSHVSPILLTGLVKIAHARKSGGTVGWGQWELPRH
jgi:hypothetical protein